MISKKNYKHDLRTVTMYLGVSNFQRAISIVIPRSRSAFSLSSTQAVPRHRSEIFTPLEIDKIHPHTILEGALAELSGLLLELLDGTLVDTTALVDQVPSGGGLAGIDVPDDYKFVNQAVQGFSQDTCSPTTLT